MKEKKIDEQDYVYGYNLIITILLFIGFIGGFIVGKDSIFNMLCVFIVGSLFIILLNLLKDILKELRKMNNK